MELRSIHLAGFKSFADPVSIPLSGQLIAIVGPNGCGKSNIVDAVRYVLSGMARQLRGGALVDIVFNGSTARKPVSCAAVELTFDNQAGRLGGEYASYPEICIRREINRDGQSHYYLNGARCRQRDIVDVFLGTGLGPDSYAIIGQGMISRLIEAKPADLRVYLEEAAGISKYQERRRETENHLRHTRENLERLTDIRTELEKQLSHLQRQANSAERYKVYKQDERLLKAQLQALNWQALAQALREQETSVQQTSVQLSTYQTGYSNLQTEISQLREHEQAHTATLNTVQTRYYEIGAEVVRLEQQLQACRQQQQQLQQELARLEQTSHAIQQHCVQDRQQWLALEQQIFLLEPQIILADKQAVATRQQLQITEQAMQHWQSRWDEFQRQEATIKQLAEVEQTRLQYCQQTIHTSEQRLTRLQQEQQQISLLSLEEEIAQLTAQLQILQTQIEQAQTHFAQTAQDITQQRDIYTGLARQLDALRQQLQQTHGRHASLQALQQEALGNNNQSLVSWLQAQKLTNQPRLVQKLQVIAGWELAVETVLGAYLQAVCIEDIATLAPQLAEFKKGQLFLVQHTNTTVSEMSETLLRSKIHSDFPLPAGLENIYIAESVAQALALLAKLQPHESVITVDGVWLAQHWARISKPQDVQAGLLQRENELQAVARQLAQQQQAVNAAQQELAEAQRRLAELEQQRDQRQQQLRQRTAESGSLQAQLSAKQVRSEDMQQRMQRLTHESQETQQQLLQTQQQLQQIQENHQQTVQQTEQYAEQRQLLLQERENCQQQIDTQRRQAQAGQQAINQQRAQLETARQQIHLRQQTLERAEQQLLDLVENQQALQAELLTATTPQQELQEQLPLLLTQRSALAEELNVAQQQVADLKKILSQQENAREALEEKIRQWRDDLEHTRIQQQALQLKQAGHQEKIQEFNYELAALLNELPPEAEQLLWEEKIAHLEQRIQRLGAINLAAIEEHQQLTERKHYLDGQNADLLEAVTTLENAIRRIDQESRGKLQETYNKVNESFGQLFQRIFNGGQASLVLTEDDWRTAGFVVHAQPPGKRNSTIHLLSGGEKTLTAIALIFAFFQLNPAPFCMLDEVDAALDDTNVGRFCHLMKEMSQQVQFILISHNKQTIAAAKKLIGVTMHEPGVSRLVTVDIDALETA